MVKTYKFFKVEILIQPPGEPREQHLGDVRPKEFENFIKDKITGMVDICTRLYRALFFTFFSSIVEKLNISSIYKSIFLIFLVENLEDNI